MKTLLAVTGSLFLTDLSAQETPKPEQAKVQIAILLDTSGSMNGLIEQTKTQLWKVVNTFISAKQNGQVPFVEVALYEYGNDRIFKDANWVRQIQPLTRDLDQISQDLFSLTTNGGSEFCGAVISRAISELNWDDNPKVYKAIFVAGNEPFTQGPINSQEACRSAVGRGVIVNTIHCGSEEQGVSGGWKSGALLADGSYLVINQNAAVVHIEAPQDARLVTLGESLNKTYIGFGKQAQSKLAMQSVQDDNAKEKAESGAAVGRAIAKASANYWNSSWDLVDACQTKDFDWTKVKTEELPKEMQELDMEGRKKYVANKLAARKVIQDEIKKLTTARNEFVAKKRAEIAKEEGANTLDVAVTNTVRKQALKKGYQFTEK
ncbi:VWA domain-containing protein [Akkermansiaceae bacterium]|nr:VWA domain-containing protein [Akkermansiaceae bacterium]